MTHPTAADYNEAIQNLRSLAGDDELRGGEVACNRLGLPMPYAGSFADVYQVRCARRTVAVKCFKTGAPGLRHRYREISEHLQRARLPFMVNFDYLENGLQVLGNWQPVLKMDWVEGGIGLNEFVQQYADRPNTLRQLLALWVKLAARLRQAEVAHADLQHGNVLLVPVAGSGQLSLKLIDYDGMQVPSLAGKPSGELGHPCYQHPQRLREGTYSAEVDRFSHLVIYCAMHSLLAGGRPLWERFNNQENLLFKEADFAEPAQSELFRELWTLRDPNARALAGHLLLSTRQPLDQVPLLEEILDGGAQVRPLSPEQERQATLLLEGRPAAAPVPAATVVPDAHIYFPCSSCGHTLRVPREHAGKHARCAQCQMIVVVPAEGVARVEPVAVAVSDQWYVQTEEGGRYGPNTTEQLKEWILAGRLTPNAWVFREGDQWRRAADCFPQLRNVASPVADTPVASNASASSPFAGASGNESGNPYQAPIVVSHRSHGPRSVRTDMKPHRGGAILTLGIMALLCNCCFVPGICAWVMGGTDLAEMRSGRMDPSGRGLTQAGYVLGIVGTGLSTLLTLVQVLAASVN